MVLVTRNWLDFKHHVDKWGYMSELVYRLDQAASPGEVRIRILAGRYGLDVTLPRNDPTFMEMEDYLKQNGAKRIEDARDVLAFFS
jgi:hypothetical protein